MYSTDVNVNFIHIYISYKLYRCSPCKNETKTKQCRSRGFERADIVVQHIRNMYSLAYNDGEHMNTIVQIVHFL